MFGLFDRENSLADNEEFVKYTEVSPERYELMTEAHKYGRRRGFGPKVAPMMVSIIRNQNKVINSLEDNPINPRVEISEVELKEIKEFAKKLGAGIVGFAEIPVHLIFKKKAILSKHAIVLGYEMDKKKIDMSPHIKCQHEVMGTYDKLGVVSNKLAKFLRKKGFAAHAGHPLMGAALYPPMAQLAGVAFLGYSGIMISPEYGPRFRLTAVYTSIENLPKKEKDEHAWVREYCKSCRICIRECPGGAILDEPIIHESGQITHVENERCMPHFVNEFGCSVCIKVCPFNNVDYYQLKENFEKKI
jgi:epoxyqueuosine reductase QueG